MTHRRLQVQADTCKVQNVYQFAPPVDASPHTPATKSVQLSSHWVVIILQGSPNDAETTMRQNEVQ